MGKLNFALIGAGRIGRVHAQNLSWRIPEVNLLAVMDSSLEAAERCATDFQIPSFGSNLNEILDDRSIDVVVICSATPSHPNLIIKAAKAGKHIFCEKPIALALNQVDEAMSIVCEQRVKFQVGFNRRFDPSFHEAHELIGAGKIGEPQLIKISSRDPHPPSPDYVKASGGIFLDMTVHDFDMARFLLDEEVEEIHAIGSVLIDPDIGKAGDLDTAIVSLRYTNGAIGTIDNSRRAVYGYDQRVEIFGSEGQIVVGNQVAHQAVYSNTKGVHSALPLYFFLERYQDSYVAEIRSFIDSVTKDAVPRVSGNDGRRALVMGLAAWESYKSRQPVCPDYEQ